MKLESLNEAVADVWVFDNDGTLYQNTRDIESAVVLLMNEYLAQLYGIEIHVASQKRKELLGKHKTKYTLVAMRKEGVDEEDFIRKTYLAVDPKDYGIGFNQRLRDVISSLAGERIVLTNNPSAFARRILDALGIQNLFSCVYGIQELWFFQKPARESFVILEGFLRDRKRVVLLDDEI